MKGDLTPALAAVGALGIGVQWLAWRVRVPSILLLLLAGIVVGPLLGVLNPDALLGDLLFPVVSLSVALILFEGGLSLHLDELESAGRAVRNLTTFGVAVAWGLSAYGAWAVAGLDGNLAILFGAILVVTGPTVIVPLLRHVRPRASLASAAKWEGIVNDPIGAVLAVLIFEAVLEGELHGAGWTVLEGVVETALVGLLLAWVAGRGLLALLQERKIPDYLQSSVTLACVFVVFVVANHLREESGLVAVTVMGILLANQQQAAVRHIVEFKENLRVLLLSTLFILLSARLTMREIAQLRSESFLFLAFLIAVARPLQVLICTAGSELDWRERVFLAWMAPRGIVAAAVTSVFALRLEDAGNPGASAMVPLMFLVILGTVTIYGLTAAPLAKLLGVGEADPQGTVVLGAHRFARALAHALEQRGFKVLLVDTNWRRVSRARMEGLRVYYGSALSEKILHRKELDGVGTLLALTSNDDVNALACIHLGHVLGRDRTYQVVPHHADHKGGRKETARHLHGRHLFREGATYEEIEGRCAAGATVKATHLTEEFPFEKFLDVYGEDALPLAYIDPDERLHYMLADGAARPPKGAVMLSLVPADASEGGEPVEPSDPPEPDLPDDTATEEPGTTDG